MNQKISITAAVVFAAGNLFAQTEPSKSTAVFAPGNLLKKSFEECEKILKAPTSVDESKPQSGVSRTYKGPIPAITKVKLIRGPQGGPDGPVPARVNLVRYYFPKGKTWKDAFLILGLNPETVKVGSSGGEKSTTQLMGNDERHITWFPSAATMKLPEGSREPDNDWIEFSAWIGEEPSKAAQPSPK